MSIDEIKELIRMLNNTDIAELSVESNGVKISIKKGSAFTAAPVAPSQAVLSPGDGTHTPPESGGEKSDSDDENNEYVTVSAPMVGTFYRAPSPDADPYVSVGDTTEVGRPLCIIEAMKLMNEIESEVKGRVVKILVENGQPVEYGQALFVIEAE